MNSASVLSAVGRTPLVELANLFGNARGVRVWAKLEMLNPGGSAKDRPALRMLRQAWEAGRVAPGSVIVESSSGNTAISLAMICAQLKLRLICVVDPRTAGNNLAILKALGAKIDYVTAPDPATGEFLPARLTRVRQLLSEIPDSFWPNQYGNEDNWRSHRETMQEILAAGPVDYVFGAISTCGTMLGCSRLVRELGLPTRIVAVDAEASAILCGSPGTGARRFPGIGAGIVPPFGQHRFWDEAVSATDLDMVRGCRMLALKEGILAGASSGGVITAVRRMLPSLPDGASCAVILHDRGERYLDTVFSDEWVSRQFGEVSWEENNEEEDAACSS